MNALLGTESGVPLRSLSGNWRCSIEWRDLRDVRSAAALPVLSNWAETLAHLPSTRLYLQSTSAVCKDTLCDSRSLRPWLSEYRSHLLVEYCTKHPIPKVADLLGLESGVPPCPLLGNQCFSAEWQDSRAVRSVLALPGLPIWSNLYISGFWWPWRSAYRNHLHVEFASMHPIPEVTTLLGSVSGIPPRPLLDSWCCSTTWPTSSDARSRSPRAVKLVRFPFIGFIGFDLKTFSAACKDTASDSRSFQPWLWVCRGHLLEEYSPPWCATPSQPGHWYPSTAWHNPHLVRSVAAPPVLTHWATTLVRFSSTGFSLQPAGTAVLSHGGSGCRFAPQS